MPRIIFVYAGDPGNGDTRSPYTITRNLYDFLRSRVNTVYREWSSDGPVDMTEDDIVLGHPNYGNTVVQWMFRHGPKCRARCLIHPLHTTMVDDNMPFDWMARQADAIFSIQGRFWYDTLEQTPFAHWKPKITRLDIPVDANTWPHRKKEFNAKGKRGVVYVGSSIPNKNLGLLTDIARAMPDVKFEWYGGSSDHALFRLPNVYVEGWQDIRLAAESICKKNDFIISTSISDANPTTLTEFGLASGLIPICTKQSGYWENDSFANIPLDVGGAVNILRNWLDKPTEDLVARSLHNRKVCEEEFNWDVFCNKIWDRLQEFL